MKTMKELASRAHEIRRSVDSRGLRRSDGSITKTSTDFDLSALAIVVAEIADSIVAPEIAGDDDFLPIARAKFLRPVKDGSGGSGDDGSAAPPPPPPPPTPPVVLPGVEPVWNDDARCFADALMREDAEGRTPPEEIIASAATMADLLSLERAARGGTRYASTPGLPQMIAEWEAASPKIIAEFERFMVQIRAAQRRVAEGLRGVDGGKGSKGDGDGGDDDGDGGSDGGKH